MNVLFVSPNFPPEFLGGTERVIAALGAHLVAAGDQVTVLSGSDRSHVGLDVLDEEFQGVPVRRVPRLAGETYGLDLSRSRVLEVCERVLDEVRPEVVHLHHWALLSTGLLRAARRLGIATVATLHDVWTTCPRFFRRAPQGIHCPVGAGREECVACVRQGLPALDEAAARAGLAARDAELRAELAAADRITVPSRSCASRIAEHLPWNGPVEVVPHGLLEPVGTADHEPGPPGVVRVGTFGNLVEEKGVLLLVWACRGIPGLELHLHGRFLDAAFEATVRDKAAEFGLPLHVHGGYDVSSDGRHPARSLDLAVFPSLCEETYGLVVEEALARGVPVVVSDRGALAERIGRGGAVVAVDELGPLANTLRRLVRQPRALDELRRGLPDHFAAIGDSARRHRDLYREILAERANLASDREIES